MKTSLRLTITTLAAFLLALGATTAALADSPHFLKASASIDGSGNLVCTFKEVGLGSTATTANISCTADASATYACINGGDKHPKASNKETVTSPVNGGDTFDVRNGQTTGSVTVAPPGPGDFSCPNGQTMVLAAVSYTNIVLTNTDNGDTADVPGTLSKTLVNVG